MSEQELKDLLIYRTSKHIEKNTDKYIHMVAVWISKILLSETKTDITFAHDPPWDTSGAIYKTKNQFEIDDYSTLDSFIENEYNGSSRPSFVSGMGMFHDFYSSELDELTDEWISLQLTETIVLLLQENNRLILEYARLKEKEFTYQIASEIAQSIYSEDIIGDFLFGDYPLELKEDIGNMAIKLLFKIGSNKANEELRKEEKQRQKMMEEENNNQEIAEKCWNKICKLHKVRYQKNMPQKVEKNYYDQYIYPILRSEFRDDISVANIQLVGKYFSFRFSNSVTFKLITYKD